MIALTALLTKYTIGIMSNLSNGNLQQNQQQPQQQQQQQQQQQNVEAGAGAAAAVVPMIIKLLCGFNIWPQISTNAMKIYTNPKRK